MDTIISNATSTFNTTTGFELSAVVDWMSSLLLLILGSGLGLLQALMPWIVALALISGVVYFLYRAFAFFRR